MKVWEILKEENEGKKYKATLKGINNHKREELFIIVYENLLQEYSHENITDMFCLSEINRMEFEEIIDWSKIPKDTKVLVSCDGKCWSRKYFSNYKNGKIYCFRACGTSWSSLNLCDSIEEWKYCKLAEEE